MHKGLGRGRKSEFSHPFKIFQFGGHQNSQKKVGKIFYPQKIIKKFGPLLVHVCGGEHLRPVGSKICEYHYLKKVRVNFSFFHSVWNLRNFDKNFVKATVLPKSWFHEIFSSFFTF